MAGHWTSGGNLITARSSLAGCGLQDAGLSIGGYTSVRVAKTEEYNGASWSAGGDITTATEGLRGCGTQNAGLCMGGHCGGSWEKTTEEYNGTTWSAGGDLTTGKYNFGACGTQTAGLAFGCDITSEEYNGTTWSAGGDLPSARSDIGDAGTQTAGLCFGGGGPIPDTEEYNGTAWSSGGDLGTARYRLAGCGSQTAALSIGGNPGPTDKTEEYNGTSWSNTANLLATRTRHAACGTLDEGLTFGGHGPLSSTEEYNTGVINFFDGKIGIGYFTKDSFDGKLKISSKVTSLFDGKLYTHTLPGVWSSGGNLLTGRHSLGGCGTQTAGLNFGGEESGDTTSSVCEEYNGTAWSAGGTLGTGRRDLSGCGTQLAGLNFGGVVAAGNKDTDITEEYNGTAWSSGGDLAVKRKQLAGAGTQSAGLSFGGDASDVLQTKTEEYNGTVWSSGGDLATAREWLAGAGTQSAGLSFGGYTTSQSVKTEEYNGTAWSAGGDLVIARSALGGCGTQLGGLSFGGTTGSDSTKTEEYNGTAWWTSGNLSTARHGLAGCGSNTAGLSFGGYSFLTNTEEYDPGPSANFTNLFDGKLHLLIPEADPFDGKVTVGYFPTNLFDGKVRIKDAQIYRFDSKIKIFDRSSNLFDGWIHLLKPTSNLFDGKVKIQYAPTNIFDGIIRIKDAFPSLLDGKIRLWSETTNLFDGWIHLLKPASNVFDGKATVESPGAEQDFFDGKLQVGDETLNLFDGKTHIHTGLSNVWMYGGNLSSAKTYMAGAGTILAGLCIGGNPSTARTEEYNGSAWSLGGDLAEAKYQSSACGLQTAALNFAGYQSGFGDTKNTEHYNGTAWSSGGDLPSIRRICGGAGFETAGLCIGGNFDGTIEDDTNEYNGTTWSAGGDLSVARYALAAAGTLTAGLSICGRNISYQPVTKTEEYNGTAWSSGGDSGNAKYELCGCGTQTSALNFMGIIGGNETATAEEYDGTSWTLVNSLNSARCRGGGCGTTALALAFGGCCTHKTSEEYTPQSSQDVFDGRLHLFELNTLLFDGRVVVTPPGIEEFDGRIHLFKHESNLFDGKVELAMNKVWLTVSGGVGKSHFGSVGTQTAGRAWGGYRGSYVYGYGYVYNGTVWSGSSNLPEPLGEVGFAGGQSDALSICGKGGPPNTGCLEFSGNWTIGPSVGYARLNSGGCGSQTSALCAGGSLYGGAYTLLTQEYNGTAWSSGGDLLEFKRAGRAVGTQSAALCFSGATFPLGNNVEEYNGTVWSADGNLTRSMGVAAGAGVQSAALCFGDGKADEYDGISWKQVNGPTHSRSASGGFGTVDAALSVAGRDYGQQYPYECYWGEEYGFAWYNIFDGKIQIKDITTDLFDGKAYVQNAQTHLFDGKAHIDFFGSDSFDGKLRLGFSWRESLLCGFGEPYKFDIDSPLGSSSRCSVIYALVVTETRSILLGLGDTIEYLLHIPLAQTERQQVVNHLSDSINAIQILINAITLGDPLSGRLPLLTSIQSESGIQSLVNELSGILAGAQKLLTALTESASGHVSLINELALKNDIQFLLVLLGSMPDPAVIHISPKLGVPLEGAPPSECAMCIYLDGIPINNQITDLSFVMDREVTFDVLSFSSSDVQLYAKLQEIVGNKDSTLEIQYKGTSWFFLIEEVSGYELSYNVWGRSIAAAKSDAPFEDSVNFVLEADTLASVVAEDLVPNLSVTWNVVDWTVLADWSVDGTPVQMLKELVDSVGAVVRSYPDGTGFYVDEKYTTRPIDLLYAESVEDYDRDVDLISLDASRDLGTRTNAVTVHGHTPFSKYSIRLEAESCVDVGNPAIIKVYPALEGAGYKLIASDGVPVYQHSLSEEHVEIVSFEGGKGSVSYPITGLKSITWDGVIPAGFEHTPGQNEIILTDDTLAAIGEVVYSTRYDVWHGTHSGEGQLLVVCYLDEGGGIVAKVYFGEGNHEADDIDRPILTSIEAAVAAGQAFLDDTSYNRLIRAITVPCSGVSDGDVVSVLSDLSGVTGNTFVLRHEISARVDNEALKITSNLDVVQFEV